MSPARFEGGNGEEAGGTGECNTSERPRHRLGHGVRGVAAVAESPDQGRDEGQAVGLGPTAVGESEVAFDRLESEVGPGAG